MEFKKACKQNYYDCFKTHTKALFEGFETENFVPVNFCKKFAENYPNYFTSLLKDKNVEMWITYENNAPIGIAIFCKYENENKTAILDSLYFRKQFCGLGFAQKTLDFVENKLKTKGYEKIVLWCSTENTRAWKFYEKNGFKKTKKIWNDILDGKTFHNFLFEKPL